MADYARLTGRSSMPQTKREIQAMLEAMGVHPLKRFGQHFLIDGNLMRKLLATAAVRADDVVLEVGPGTGSLTEELVQQAGHVVAVEIDRTLQALCQDRLGRHANFTLIAGDILESKNAIAPDVLQALQERQQQLGGRVLLVANLPYQAATPLIIDLLTVKPAVAEMCFTIQAEVADRLKAPSGGKEYGPLSILTQALADVQRIARVPPEAFWPAPEVDSAIVHIVVKPKGTVPDAIQRRLAELVHGCFNHRRKTLRWSLRNMPDESALARVEADGRWDLTLRPEIIDVDGWIAMARLLG
jgi:16S rRNA (adenine1518-N6/adenine1519-N6)-dimethyltransferase